VCASARAGQDDDSLAQSSLGSDDLHARVNQSWNRVVKYFSASRCDRLFVVVADGRRWFIPAEAVGGGSGIHLGGPKYADFEVEPGRPLAYERT
jgi:hypothetical protein